MSSVGHDNIVPGVSERCYRVLKNAGSSGQCLLTHGRRVSSTLLGSHGRSLNSQSLDL